MNQPPAPTKAAAITPRHYQAVCGLSLATILLIQTQQSGLYGSVRLLAYALIIGLGAAATLNRIRISPVLVLLAMAVPQLADRWNLFQHFHSNGDERRFLDVADILTCMAALSYFIGHYRLLALWSGVLAKDTGSILAQDTKGGPPQVRSESSLSAAEFISLIFAVPAFAFLAQLVCLFLVRQTALATDPRWNQFLIVIWTILLGVFLFGQAFRYWQRLQMDHASAILLLQDVLWHETRGEQRRIQRWLAWRKLRAKKNERFGGAA